MRFVALQRAGERRLAVRLGQGLVDLQALDQRWPAELSEILLGGAELLRSLATAMADAPRSACLRSEEIRPLRSIAEPSKLLCLGLNYDSLEVGHLLVMGTSTGVGAARQPPVWMKPGDVCEVEIEGIGTLRNPIADESA